MEYIYGKITIARTLRDKKISQAGRVWRSKKLIGQITKCEPRTRGDPENSLDKVRRTKYRKNKIVGCEDNIRICKRQGKTVALCH